MKKGMKIVLAAALLLSSTGAFALDSGIASMMSSYASSCAGHPGGYGCTFEKLVQAAKPDAMAALAGQEQTRILKEAVAAVQKNAKDKNIDVSVEEAIKFIALSE
jgi:hypothetical protein